MLLGIRTAVLRVAIMLRLNNTTLYNGMILSTFSISSHMALLWASPKSFPKGLVPIERVFFDYKSIIIPYLSQGGTF